MQTVLIDTDVAIDFLRGLDTARNLITPLWQQGNAYLSLLSAYELYAGMLEKEVIVTNNFIRACQIEPLTLEISQKAGELYQYYRKQGLTLTSIDCLIFATAKIQRHLIATRNLRHYPDSELLLKREW